ncbi:MAG: hypothetical protein MJ211_07860 [Bacteroidales bacterium]|nr:hypothetical protein [Bacteroidales bacterium]
MNKKITMFNQEDIFLLIKAIKDNGGYDFSNYSEKSFARRVEKVLIDYRLDIYSLINRVKIDKPFLEEIIKSITVNTTELFRDPQAWQALKYRVLPRLLSKSEINIWHAGCSIGLEVYSMIILLNELGVLNKTKIYATDINSDVLKTAESGVYSYRAVSEYLNNFNSALCENPYNFDEHLVITHDQYFDINKFKDTFKVKPEFLGKVIFKKHDLVNDKNPFDIKYDLILCRNVLIYFNNSLQNKLFVDFWNYLQPNGALLLGIHESIIGPLSAKFDKKGLVYFKKL